MHLRRVSGLRGSCLALVLLGATSLATSAHDMMNMSPAHPAHQPSAKMPDVTPFLAENARAMDTMMADMDVKPTGDVNVDFAAMMIPHHQGAIDMAVAYLRYGDNPQLRRLAQEIIVEQQQEITAMRLALGQPLPASQPAPTQQKVMAAGSETMPATTAHNHAGTSICATSAPETKSSE